MRLHDAFGEGEPEAPQVLRGEPRKARVVFDIDDAEGARSWVPRQEIRGATSYRLNHDMLAGADLGLGPLGTALNRANRTCFDLLRLRDAAL